jgi:hypothetical protein
VRDTFRAFRGQIPSIASMSLDPSNADRLEETLASTREGVRKLEIDTYRLRTNLTRLEAALEDSLANGDCAVTPGVEEALERPIPPKSRARSDVPVSSFDSLSVGVADPFGDVVASDSRLETAARVDPVAGLDVALPQAEPGGSIEDGPSPADLASAAVVKTRPRWRFRFATPSVLASVSLHGAPLLMILSITVATIVHEQKPFTTYVNLGDKPPEPAQVENLDLGQVAQLDETKLEGGARIRNNWISLDRSSGK